MLSEHSGDCDGTLIFAGLFSAVVTAFFIKSVDLLRPDSGDMTVQLLAQIALKLEGESVPLQQIQQSNVSFKADLNAIWINGMWIASLILSISSVRLLLRYSVSTYLILHKDRHSLRH